MREAEPPSTEPNSTRGAKRGLLRRRQRGGTLLGEADCTGLDPEAVYVYVERSQGRANRPFLAGEHRCGEASRTLLGKPAQSGDESANYSAKQISTGSKIEPNTTHKLQVLSKSNGSLRLAPGRSATKRGSARPPMRSAQ